MPALAFIADCLTSLRVLLAGYVLTVGWTQGASGLTSAAWTLLAGWACDLLDGPLARRAGPAHPTRLADHDLTADVLLAGSVWAYLALGGFVSAWVAAAYALLAAVVLYVSRSQHWAWGIQAVPYGAIILVALRQAPLVGRCMVTWIVFVVVATWPRFPQRTLPEFLAGMSALFSGTTCAVGHRDGSDGATQATHSLADATDGSGMEKEA